tara:strand:- start:5457 stop:5876 length:420 start_codon:yes stop_codon:yes gene_type:complete
MAKEIIKSKPKTINHPDGNILRVLRSSDNNFKGFGEAYFSMIGYNKIKAWKKHREMTMNLIVPVGEVMFVFKDSQDIFSIEKIGEKNYMCLTVPPGVWFGFKGLGENINLILNISNIQHNDTEVERADIDNFTFDWGKA